MSERLLTVLAGVGGYALGTVQILLVDWMRRRRDHKKNLRTLRAEIERTLTLGAKFEREGMLAEDFIPKPPEVTPVFAELVTSTEFYLTDEFEGDNTQKVMLSVLDGIDSLKDTHRQIRERVDQLQATRGEEGAPRTRWKKELRALADSYNEKLGRFQAQLESSLGDIDRRLEEARYHEQMFRQLRDLTVGLPEGENPEPLGPGDLRAGSG